MKPETIVAHAALRHVKAGTELAEFRHGSRKPLGAAVVAGLANAGGGIGANRECSAGQQPGLGDERGRCA